MHHAKLDAQNGGESYTGTDGNLALVLVGSLVGRAGRALGLRHMSLLVSVAQWWQYQDECRWCYSMYRPRSAPKAALDTAPDTEAMRAKIPAPKKDSTWVFNT